MAAGGTRRVPFLGSMLAVCLLAAGLLLALLFLTANLPVWPYVMVGAELLAVLACVVWLVEAVARRHRVPRSPLWRLRVGVVLGMYTLIVQPLIFAAWFWVYLAFFTRLVM